MWIDLKREIPDHNTDIASAEIPEIMGRSDKKKAKEMDANS